ncbi:rnapii degradation factor [Schizosaccharomyces japonicus yFS275]|uniref:RNA polymerase II degradation factor 1 n=1 Tax=Schizosaccharomyces japonicus (strain yFS275 / FY16936) TaxID=402676 RepID=B6K1K5_SCHJY|nr:rnapii degradation factor [Schizosaccharomyces japonicus yFS275]EEB07036.1 rnapii degradation factor [Schizosaccharomyces japonicus yFS275]
MSNTDKGRFGRTAKKSQPRKQASPASNAKKNVKDGNRISNQPQLNIDVDEELLQPTDLSPESKVNVLRELFPEWTEEDLHDALRESDNDLEITILHISEGHASKWETKKKPPKTVKVPKSSTGPESKTVSLNESRRSRKHRFKAQENGKRNSTVPEAVKSKQGETGIAKAAHTGQILTENDKVANTAVSLAKLEKPTGDFDEPKMTTGTTATEASVTSREERQSEKTAQKPVKTWASIARNKAKDKAWVPTPTATVMTKLNELSLNKTKNTVPSPPPASNEAHLTSAPSRTTATAPETIPAAPVHTVDANVAPVQQTKISAAAPIPTAHVAAETPAPIIQAKSNFLTSAAPNVKNIPTIVPGSTAQFVFQKHLSSEESVVVMPMPKSLQPKKAGLKFGSLTLNDDVVSTSPIKSLAKSDVEPRDNRSTSNTKSAVPTTAWEDRQKPAGPARQQPTNAVPVSSVSVAATVASHSNTRSRKSTTQNETRKVGASREPKEASSAKTKPAPGFSGISGHSQGYMAGETAPTIGGIPVRPMYETSGPFNGVPADLTPHPYVMAANESTSDNDASVPSRFFNQVDSRKVNPMNAHVEGYPPSAFMHNLPYMSGTQQQNNVPPQYGMSPNAELNSASAAFGYGNDRIHSQFFDNGVQAAGVPTDSSYNGNGVKNANIGAATSSPLILPQQIPPHSYPFLQYPTQLTSYGGYKFNQTPQNYMPNAPSEFSPYPSAAHANYYARSQAAGPSTPTSMSGPNGGLNADKTHGHDVQSSAGDNVHGNTMNGGVSAQNSANIANANRGTPIMTPIHPMAAIDNNSVFSPQNIPFSGLQQVQQQGLQPNGKQGISPGQLGAGFPYGAPVNVASPGLGAYANQPYMNRTGGAGWYGPSQQ